MALTQEMIKALPVATGIYIMKDSAGRVIYVGKALNLRSRVGDYMGADSRPYVRHIRQNATAVEVLITANEKEALLLENQLIKRHRPRYNILLKDDKTFVSLKLTMTHDFPGLYITRKVLKDGSRYFGPYSSSQATRKTLSAIGRIFPVRRCSDGEFRNRSRPCLYHQIGLCLAPCCRRVDVAEYRAVISDLTAFLEGRNSELEAGLQKRMRAYAEELDFERAAQVRDQIQAIKSTLVPQMVMGTRGSDVDVLGTFLDRDHCNLVVLSYSAGSLIDSRSFSFDDNGSDLMRHCLMQLYENKNVIPNLIYMAELPDAHQEIADILSERRGARVELRKAVRGRPLNWLRMAEENARQGQAAETVLDDIARYLHLPRIPYRMECYDISTIQGRHSVGSRTVFVGGEPDKSLYRRYKISGVKGQDDFAMLYEVLQRRFENDESRPDLLVIDGGKGQLNSCLKILRELKLEQLPIVSLAKERGNKSERFFLPGRKDPIHMPARSAALKVMVNIRDEAHRFAITYHRNLRSSQTFVSTFEEIAGIGPAKAAKLLKFTAAKDFKELTRADLEGCPGISERDIASILDYIAQH